MPASNKTYLAELREALYWYKNPAASLEATRAAQRKLSTAAEALIEVAEAASDWLEDWRGPESRGGQLELHGEPEAAFRLASALSKLSGVDG